MKGLTVGKFDRKITFLKKVEQATEFNTGKLSYVPLDGNSTWCNVMPYRTGGEVKRADQVTEQRITLFYVRYRTDIDVTMRIAWGSQVYNIVAIAEPAVYRKQILEISGEVISEETWG